MFTFEKLQKIQEQIEGESKEVKKFPISVFIPEGNHKGRFIADSDDELFCEYYAYGYFAKGIRDPQGLDKKDLPEGFDIYNHPLKKISNELSNKFNIYSKSSKQTFICYFYLMETDKPSKNWKPNNLYILIGVKQFKESFHELIVNVTKRVEENAVNTFVHSEKGFMVSLSCHSGTYLTNIIKPEILTEPLDIYNPPLEKSYINPGFNKSRYDKLVSDCQIILNEKEPKQIEVFKESQPPVEIVVEPPIEKEAVVEPTNDKWDKFKSHGLKSKEEEIRQKEEQWLVKK